MRTINLLVVHCSATPQGLDIGAKEIRGMHMDPRRPGGPFADIGYHYVIRENGTIEKGRADDVIGAHVQGWNSNSLGICLVGGLDLARKPANTFTPAQFESLEQLLRQLYLAYPITRTCGHRDLSPDLNHDGRIEPNEWMKQCPCFDVEPWFVERGLARTQH